jgi:hypothetical protein
MDGLSLINKREINFLLVNGWEIQQRKNVSFSSVGWLVLHNSKFEEVN